MLTHFTTAFTASDGYLDFKTRNDTEILDLLADDSGMISAGVVSTQTKAKRPQNSSSANTGDVGPASGSQITHSVYKSCKVHKPLMCFEMFSTLASFHIFFVTFAVPTFYITKRTV